LQNEHLRFLEALKLYGKDWELIEKHVGNRDIKNIRSHAQKFLARLLRLLEGEEKIKELTLEEAEFYFGILNKKLHKSMKPKEEVSPEFLRPYELFKIEKITRPHEELAYEKWKEEMCKQSTSKSIMSIGLSVKVMMKSVGLALERFCF